MAKKNSTKPNVKYRRNNKSTTLNVAANESVHYSRQAREIAALTLLYVKTGNEQYAKIASKIRASLKEGKENQTVAKVRYAAQGSQGAQGYGGQTQGFTGYGTAQRPAQWFNGYKYYYEADTGEYARWVYLGGKSRRFTLKEAKKAAKKELRKNPKLKEFIKRNRKEIKKAKKGVKFTPWEWDSTQTTQIGMDRVDVYTCLTHGNHLNKAWASYAITVARMKKDGASQKEINAFMANAVERTVDVFRRAYLHNGNEDALYYVMKGFLPQWADKFAENIANAHSKYSLKDQERYAEYLVRETLKIGARKLVGEASSTKCVQYAKERLAKHKKGLQRGYMDLSKPRTKGDCKKAIESWQEKPSTNPIQEKIDAQQKARQKAKQSAQTNRRPDQPNAGNVPGTGGGGGSGTRTPHERTDVAGGGSGRETNTTGDRQGDRRTSEPARPGTGTTAGQKEVEPQPQPQSNADVPKEKDDLRKRLQKVQAIIRRARKKGNDTRRLQRLAATIKGKLNKPANTSDSEQKAGVAPQENQSKDDDNRPATHDSEQVRQSEIPKNNGPEPNSESKPASEPESEGGEPLSSKGEANEKDETPNPKTEPAETKKEENENSTLDSAKIAEQKEQAKTLKKLISARENRLETVSRLLDEFSSMELNEDNAIKTLTSYKEILNRLNEEDESEPYKYSTVTRNAANKVPLALKNAIEGIRNSQEESKKTQKKAREGSVKNVTDALNFYKSCLTVSIDTLKGTLKKLPPSEENEETKSESPNADDAPQEKKEKQDAEVLPDNGELDEQDEDVPENPVPPEEERAAFVAYILNRVHANRKAKSAPKVIEAPITTPEDAQARTKPGLAPGVPNDKELDYNNVYSVPITKLHLDPKRFQFKLKTDEKTGAGDLYKGAEFNPKLANTILVWRDPDDKKDYVVNGHHRMSIARDSGYTGEIRVVYSDAKTAQEAMAEGAIANMADGKGTSIDVADVLRHYPQIEENNDVLRYISKNNKLVKDGRALARLSPKLYEMAKTEELPISLAAIIGRYINANEGDNEQRLLQEEKQWLVYKKKIANQKHPSPTEIEGYAATLENQGLRSAKKDGYSGGLFDMLTQDPDMEARLDAESALYSDLLETLSDTKKAGKILSNKTIVNNVGKKLLPGGANTKNAQEALDAARGLLSLIQPMSGKKTAKAKNVDESDETVARNIITNAQMKYSEFFLANRDDKKALEAERKRMVKDTIQTLAKKIFDSGDALNFDDDSATETQTPPETAPTPKAENTKTAVAPKSEEPPRQESQPKAEPAKAKKPKTTAPKKASEPKSKTAQKPKAAIDPKYRNAGKDLEDEHKKLLQFMKKAIGDGKISDYNRFLTEAAKAMSSKDEEYAPSYCSDVIDELADRKYVDIDENGLPSISEKGRAALLNFDAAKNKGKKKQKETK